MDDEERLEKEAAVRVANSPEWFYCGRNNSTPKWNTILMCCVADVGQFATASNVFEALKLDLEKLSEIFHTDPPAKSYEDLEFCGAYEEASWSKLAVLTGKTINWALCHGTPEGRTIRIYRPDGSIEEVD